MVSCKRSEAAHVLVCSSVKGDSLSGRESIFSIGVDTIAGRPPPQELRIIPVAKAKWKVLKFS